MMLCRAVCKLYCGERAASNVALPRSRAEPGHSRVAPARGRSRLLRHTPSAASFSRRACSPWGAETRITRLRGIRGGGRRAGRGVRSWLGPVAGCARPPGGRAPAAGGGGGGRGGGGRWGRGRGSRGVGPAWGGGRISRGGGAPRGGRP